MKKRGETHTIQVWPSGTGYEYRGIVGAGGGPRRLRCHGFNREPTLRWRKGTASEWAAIETELRVDRYIEVEVLKCDSMLVSDLIQATTHQDMGEIGHEWEYNRVSNLYPDPSEWDDQRCNEWLDDHGVEGAIEDNDADNLRDLVTEHTEAAEIMEWWAVTEWLADQLKGIGEPVLDNAYGYWWGRTCTGQAMKMDGTLQQIARQYA